MKLAKDLTLSGRECFFKEDEIIVSKTNCKGHITYANRIFIDIAGFTEAELIGQPHSIMRHPEMPRAVFKLLWDTLGQGKEIFAYVVNRCKNGDHYWVYAHVTPSFCDGEIVGYHSNRRVPDREIVDKHIIPLYKTLSDIESAHKNRKEGLAASHAAFEELLREAGMAYDEFVMTLGQRRRRGYRGANSRPTSAVDNQDTRAVA